MILSLHFVKPFSSDYKMKTSYKRLKSNVGLVSDSLSVSRSTFEEFDFTENGRKFKSADFNVSSLLSVGAFDMLKPTFVSSMSDMDYVDGFQSFELPKSE